MQILSTSERLVLLLAASFVVPRAIAMAQPASEALILNQVEQVLEALPTLGPEVLVEDDGENWVSPISFEAVYTAVGDTPPVAAALPEGATRLEARDRMVALEPERGEVRYISRARAWRFTNDSGTTPVDKAAASTRVEETFRLLGFPSEEVCSRKVATQVGTISPTRPDAARSHFGIYRIVTFLRCRKSLGLRVEGSEVRAAVSNHDVIQRLRIVWPALTVPSGLSFRDRDHILEQAVAEIMAGEPEVGVEIRGRYAYMPLSPTETKRGTEQFVPAVIFLVISTLTPYQVAVPVAEQVTPQ